MLRHQRTGLTVRSATPILSLFVEKQRPSDTSVGVLSAIPSSRLQFFPCDLPTGSRNAEHEGTILRATRVMKHPLIPASSRLHRGFDSFCVAFDRLSLNHIDLPC